MKDDTISRQVAIDAVTTHGTELERRGITVLSVSNHKQVTVDLLESLPSVDAVDRRVLAETIKHYAQYPDGMSRLLEVYGGNDGEDDIKRDM